MDGRLAPDALAQALRRPLPGAVAQDRMAPRPRRSGAGSAVGTLREAAVLLLLYPADGAVRLVLTRRADTVANHRSQISLPGGATEGDEPAVTTALRETEEELGVSPRGVRVLGALSDLHVFASGFLVHPVVGWAAIRPAFRPDAREVAEVLEAPAADLPGFARSETWSWSDGEREVPFYLIGGHKVWGATAMILSEFLDLALPD